MIDKIKKFIEKINLKSISIQLVGITFELGFEGINKAELQEILRDLYATRRVLSDFYFDYQTHYALLCESEGIYEFDSESKELIGNDTDIEEKLAEIYFAKALDLYENIEKSYCESKYFVYLPRKTREKLIEIFNNVRIINSTFKVDEDASLETEEAMPVVQDILYLYNGIENVINKVNDKLENNK